MIEVVVLNGGGCTRETQDELARGRAPLEPTFLADTVRLGTLFCGGAPADGGADAHD